MLRLRFVLLVLALLASLSTSAELQRLDKDRYVDKLKGAWAGQMIGVAFGWPYEFVFNAKPILEDLKPWSPEVIATSIQQDDIYVEMTFLKALEDHGLDITYEEAGKAFAASEYQLWHANLFGRENVRRGIMPPMSGHPEFNQHADDIDFQIEADLIGILCPGMPQESNRLSGIFGRIMNYGDGLYGGMFVAAMYAAAYFEDDDVMAVINAGLAAIPAESNYHKIISDVIQWHAAEPKDWLSVWHKIEDKWQTDVDCLPGSPVNINASLNGAYIVMGLLYGEGDLAKTIEISVRCGQDADCNPSNAAGVLACMKGYSALEEKWISGIAPVADETFSYTEYSWNTLMPASQRMTEATILRAGGKVEADHYMIAVQAPRPPATFEQWTDRSGGAAVTQRDVDFWQDGWKLVACGTRMEPGYNDKEFRRHGVLKLHPVDEQHPAVIVRDVAVPAAGARFVIDVASYKSWRGTPTVGDYVLKIFVAGQLAKEVLVASPGKWLPVEIDLSAHAGKTVPVRLENHANGWNYEGAYLDKPVIK